MTSTAIRPTLIAGPTSTQPRRPSTVFHSPPRQHPQPRRNRVLSVLVGADSCWFPRRPRRSQTRCDAMTP